MKSTIRWPNAGRNTPRFLFLNFDHNIPELVVASVCAGNRFLHVKDILIQCLTGH